MSKKDANGIYQPTYMEPKPISVTPEPTLKNEHLDDLDAILKAQLLTLGRATKQLATRSVAGDMTRDEINNLATLIKVSLDLKAKEKELLADLDDDALE